MTERIYPKEWITVSINDISIKGLQRKPSNEEQFIYVDIGSIDRKQKTITSPQNLAGIDAPSRARKAINSGDILVSLTRPNLNAVALVSDKYDGQIASTGFEVIKPIIIESRYVFAFVRSKKFIESISGKVQGALYPAAKSADVKAHKFPLPALAEQKEIATRLDHLLAQVDSLKNRLDALPKLLKRFRQSVLAAAVSGKLNKTDRMNYFKCIKLEDCLDIISGIAFKQAQYTEYGSRLLQIANVGHGKTVWEKESFISIKLAEEYSNSTLMKDDIVLALNRPITHNTLKVSMISDRDLPAILYQRVARLRPKKTSSLTVKYCYLAMSSGDFKKQVFINLKGSDQPYLNTINLKKLKISIPSIQEQTEIVTRVETLFAFADKLEQRIEQAQNHANTLTPALLAKAFSGELTADWRKQNPDLIQGENSAEALLARIKAEREQLTPKRKTRKKRAITLNGDSKA